MGMGFLLKNIFLNKITSRVYILRNNDFYDARGNPDNVRRRF